ncbi:YrhB domain-containing protein [Streptomyces sp. NPDC059740]|uniref:YrhB domain-containing protein n=1 Tax=Streptomyces sp. NPDC059740 TaxID=3346926 RepID=UPI00366778AD
MLNHSEAISRAESLLSSETNPDDPELEIDYENVEERNGILIIPFNSVQYLDTRDAADMLLDCWPILVDLATGKARMGTIMDRHIWM